MRVCPPLVECGPMRPGDGTLRGVALEALVDVPLGPVGVVDVTVASLNRLSPSTSTLWSSSAAWAVMRTGAITRHQYHTINAYSGRAACTMQTPSRKLENNEILLLERNRPRVSNRLPESIGILLSSFRQ